MRNFNQYVWEFYGYHGVYPMGASREVIDRACDMVSKAEKFCADSHDREKVRGLLEMWGYREPFNPKRVAAWLRDITVSEYEKDPKDRDWFSAIGEVVDYLEAQNGR